MNQQQNATATVNFQNITWAIKQLTTDFPKDLSETLNYETRTQMQIRNDLGAISIDLNIRVTDAVKQDSKVVADLVLTLSAQVEGLQQFISGTQVNIPGELPQQLILTMCHTARGILMQAGRGTSLERWPLPLFGPEQFGQGQVTQTPTTQTVN